MADLISSDYVVDSSGPGTGGFIPDTHIEARFSDSCNSGDSVHGLTGVSCALQAQAKIVKLKQYRICGYIFDCPSENFGAHLSIRQPFQPFCLILRIAFP